MSKLLKRIFLITSCWLLVVGSWQTACAQSPKTKKTIRGEGLLLRPISNKAFTQLFSGVFSANLSMNWDFNHFTTGVYYNIMQCQIFPKFQSDPHAIQTVHTGGLRFGYDIYPSKAKLAAQKGNFLVMTPYIMAGFSQVDYTRLKCLTGSPTGKNSQALSVTAGWNFTIMMNEYDGVGFTIGYSYLNHEFNPDPLCLTQYYPNIPEADKKGLSQYIIYGFNAHFDLVKRNPEGD